MSGSALLSVDGLTVRLPAGNVLRDISLSIGPGEALGLVGESGSGKSMTARAIARLLPSGAVLRGPCCSAVVLCSICRPRNCAGTGRRWR